MNGTLGTEIEQQIGKWYADMEPVGSKHGRFYVDGDSSVDLELDESWVLWKIQSIDDIIEDLQSRTANQSEMTLDGVWRVREYWADLVFEDQSSTYAEQIRMEGASFQTLQNRLEELPAWQSEDN